MRGCFFLKLIVTDSFNKEKIKRSKNIEVLGNKKELRLNLTLFLNYNLKALVASVIVPTIVLNVSGKNWKITTKAINKYTTICIKMFRFIANSINTRPQITSGP